MKLEFAKPGTFSYWVQAYFAGCVHPSEREEAIALHAWQAGRLALLEDMDRSGALAREELHAQGVPK